MSNNHPDKKRKGANGAAVPIKVESRGQQHAANGVAPPDDSNLSPIERLLRVELWKDDAKAVEEALTELANMCSSTHNSNAGRDNLIAVARAGGSALIAVAMRKWYAFPVIQGKACLVLQNTSFRSCKDTGVLDAITWAMKSHPNDIKVQENGCSAISKLISPKTNADYIVKQLKVVDLILSAMNTFKHDVMLQKSACYTLRNILDWYMGVWHDDIKDAVLQAPGDARQALLDAIKNHADTSKQEVKELQENASEALKILLP